MPVPRYFCSFQVKLCISLSTVFFLAFATLLENSFKAFYVFFKFFKFEFLFLNIVAGQWSPIMEKLLAFCNY